MPFVLDTSVAGAWAVADELSRYTDFVEDLLLREGAIVPPLWWYEIRNFVLTCERSGRLDTAESAEFLSVLETYPIEIDRAFEQHRTMDLARRYKLTAYDAAFLELAIRLRTPLASLDGALVKAAKAEKIVIVTPTQPRR